MSDITHEKHLLIRKVFEKAKEDSLKTTKTALAKYLELIFLEDLKFSISYKTFDRYYEGIFLQKNPNYPIDKEILDVLSRFLSYKDFFEFCHENMATEQRKETTNPDIIKINDELIKEKLPQQFFGQATQEKIEKQLNSNLPKEHITPIIQEKQQRLNRIILIGLGVLTFWGIFYFGTIPGFQQEKQMIEKNINSQHISSVPIQIVQIPNNKGNISVDMKPKVESKIITKRRKECMVWKGTHYDSVYCDSAIPFPLEVLNPAQFQIKKIEKPDTLTIENSIGKVWYSKNKGKVEFFTSRGVHPITKKELNHITPYMIKTHILHIKK